MKKKNRMYIIGLLVIMLFSAYVIFSKKDIRSEKEEITVVAYYFPNYHEDKRNSAFHGQGWTEWELVKTAKPRFANHKQPNIPAWGYTDEADPKDMSQKINAAVDYGIDVFLFDWYMYEDGPFLNRAIDEGFLKAENSEQIKFAFMWANHDWIDIHPYKKGTPHKLLYPGKVSPERYEEICDLLIDQYFSKPNYWKIDGKVYFSIYDIQRFIEGFGNIEATRMAMELMNEKVVAAGLKGVHWNLVSWDETILPVEDAPENNSELANQLGFNSVTSYVWIHHVKLPETKTDYNYVRDAYFKYWDSAKEEFDLPYYPNVTMGWDPTPRCDLSSKWEDVGYPFMNTLGNNTPANFKTALQMTKDKLLSDPDGPRILNINCWNEWTEGSYLEPDTVNGMKYLEAIRDVYN